jgi:spermidine synthase
MSQGGEIFRCHDEYGSIQVFDEGNKRYLAFAEGDEQSCQLKSDPFLLQHDYTQAMLLVLLFKSPHNMILFGLGGGAIATTLHQYLPGLKIRVVELRPKVVAIAHRFFQFPRSKRIEVFTEDASEFLEREQQAKTDLLFSDMYCADGLDMQQTQPWFIERCYRLLKDDGWLVLNCWQVHRGEQEMLAALKTYFKDVRVCSTVEGNWVILAGKEPYSGSAAQLKASAKQWSKVLGYSLASSLGRLNSLS